MSAGAEITNLEIVRSGKVRITVNGRDLTFEIVNTEMAALVMDLVAIVNAHDRMLGALHAALIGLAFDAASDTRAKAYSHVRDILLELEKP